MSLFAIVPNDDSVEVCWEDIKYCSDVTVGKRLLISSTLYQIKHWIRRGITLESQIPVFIAESRMQEYGLDPDTQTFEYIGTYCIGNLAHLLSTWRESLKCTDEFVVREAIKNPDTWFGAITCIE